MQRRTSHYMRVRRRSIRAQSPGLALSALATRLGDRAGALAAITAVFILPRGPGDEDPWWTYHKAQGRNDEELLTQLRRPFLEATP